MISFGLALEIIVDTSSGVIKGEIEAVETALVVPGESNPQAEENEVTPDEAEEATPTAEEEQE